MNNQNRIAPVITILALAFATSVATAADTPMAKSLRSLNDVTGEKLVVTHQAAGYVSHLRALSNPIPELSSLPSEARARTFFATYRDLFVDANTPLDLSTVRVSPVDAGGTSYVRLQQSYKGIPVRGGEAIVHLGVAGVTSVDSKLQHDLAGVEMTPQIQAGEAIEAARVAIAKRYKSSAAKFGVPQLEIVNVEQLRGSKAGAPRLAWLFEVTGDLDELIWIDAQTGVVLAQVSRIAHLLDRNVTDAQGVCYSDITNANPNYNDDGIAPDNTVSSESFAAWNYSQSAYNFFNTFFSRDGFDGTGKVNLAVNICAAAFDPHPGLPAPSTENASWYPSANQMLFGAGMAAADDIVAHEYTHAIIDNIDNGKGRLLLVGQSGALAEAFADIFGEVVDLTQAVGNDAGNAKWDIGEATGQSFRNLMEPNLHDGPGKVTDPKFYCGADNDIAIHVNGSVLSHAFALLVDGGSYNGVTVNGIGIEKAARVFYKALSEYLVSTSSFNDAYQALQSAAAALTGTVISAEDSAAVLAAITAVELDVSPCSSKLAYCPTGFSATNLFKDDFENPASGNWVSRAIAGVNHWISQDGTSGIYRPAAVDAGASFIGAAKPLSGKYALWADNSRFFPGSSPSDFFGNSVVAMNNAVVIPANSDVRLQFEQNFDFQVGAADGGILEYSVDGGTTWINVKDGVNDLITGGLTYENTISDQANNPLGTQWGFVESTNDLYVSTQLNLTSLAGQSVQFRFHMGTNRYSARLGWLVDDVAIYTCAETTVTTPVVPEPARRKRKGGAWDVFSILVMFGFMWGARRRRSALARRN